MALYMIAGKVDEDCIIKIIQDDEYKAEKKVVAGTYSIYFESDSNSNITAAAENSSGVIISFGSIKPIEVLKPNVFFEE